MFSLTRTVVLIACVAVLVAARPVKKYNTKAGPVPGKLNVNLACHTHDDVGWLKTVDEYYLGANNSIQHAGVQYILDSVMVSLRENPDRRFSYVEIAFFERWWNEQDDAMKDFVRQLVREERFVFINAGLSMNDEATTHYRAIIDNMAAGHEFVLREFGVRPTIGWHIDPFGHSNTQASLFASMGFDAFYFARIDYQDFNKRMNQSTMEMVWRGSESLGTPNQLFTGVLRNGYGPPDGFCFDLFCDDSQPLNDDPELFNVNIKDRVDAFVAAALEQNSHYHGNHIMMTMGSDFQYENANEWFKNLDKLIHYVNLDGRVNVYYSNPEMYTRFKNQAAQTWTVKNDDFFPYFDGPHAAWTGYFVSRVGVKGYVRDMGGFLQTCRQAEVFSPASTPTVSSNYLKQAMGIAQHHDAVSGTEKQHVAYDYAKRLSIGEGQCEQVVVEAWAKLASKGNPQIAPLLQRCRLLNVSQCDVTEVGGSQVVLVYNPVVHSRAVHLHVPLKVGLTSVRVSDHQGNAINAQVVPLFAQRSALVDTKATHEVVFIAPCPALGFTTVFIEPTSGDDKLRAEETIVKVAAPDADTVLENAHLAIVFDGVSGHIKQIRNKASGLVINGTQQFFWYNSSNGNAEDGQPGGAYITRPNATTPFEVGNVASLTVTGGGSLVTEVRQVFADWLVQTVRLYQDSMHAELLITVGAIPFRDGLGKELFYRFTTDLDTQQLFYTDANGREMQTRKINFRPTWALKVTEPVVDNYYPVNSRAAIRDAGGKAQLTIVTDRSCSGASLGNGQLEIGIHRRLLHDDYRGVDEPLNETGLHGDGLHASIRHFLFLEPAAMSARLHRPFAVDLYAPAVPTFAPLHDSVQNYVASHNTRLSYAPVDVEQNIPANLNLLTLERRAADRLLLRIEHIFGINEDPTLSQPIVVDLNNLFSTIEILGVVELSLSGNQPKSDVHRLQWKTDDLANSEEVYIPSATPNIVTLRPMEIHTYELTIRV